LQAPGWLLPAAGSPHSPKWRRARVDRAAAARAALNDALAALLARAQEQGGVRGDVTGAELLALLGAVHQAAEASQPSVARLLSIVCDGLRVR
jgi:hypothetical protein